ncbi:uncharacterized protein [Rutidosis leptorrhynchoides]|uniref:uncharacterized protein n=1 Tax=Rutidosis leptorrhynchoides TaxID=125765 RepID=UPI003A9A4BAF
MHKGFIGNHPWVLMGVFNASLAIIESSSSTSIPTIVMREFKECVDRLEVLDVNQTGLQFTWNQQPNATSGLLWKIDRIMANEVFIEKYSNAYGIFQPYRIYDHSPAILKLQSGGVQCPKPFSFSNHVALNDDFKPTVNKVWNMECVGHKMYQVVSKLRSLKKPLRKLMWSKGNLHDRVNNIKKELDMVQIQLDQNPNSVELRVKESATLKLSNEALIEEETYLRQRAKIKWLRVGDCNSSYFHKVFKGKVHRSHIHSVADQFGHVFEGAVVPQVFVDHFTNFLGTSAPTLGINEPNSLFNARIPSDVAIHMVRPVLDEEVRSPVFGIGDFKSPGPDGFSALFFKKTWDIIRAGIMEAIKEFFINGQFLKEINHTVIALLPKTNVPSQVNDFRPISCCNVLYKIISKIVTNRIKMGLNWVVSENQFTFIPGRRISDNILLT